MCRTDWLPDQHAPRVWDRAGGKRDRQRQTDSRTQATRQTSGRTNKKTTAGQPQRETGRHPYEQTTGQTVQQTLHNYTCPRPAPPPAKNQDHRPEHPPHLQRPPILCSHRAVARPPVGWKAFSFEIPLNRPHRHRCGWNSHTFTDILICGAGMCCCRCCCFCQVCFKSLAPKTSKAASCYRETLAPSKSSAALQLAGAGRLWKIWRRLAYPKKKKI